MILYHTSSVEVHNPDTLHSRKLLDFGIGFYLTSLQPQALKYGQLKYAKPNNQYCIRTQAMLDRCLIHKESKKL